MLITQVPVKCDASCFIAIDLGCINILSNTRPSDDFDSKLA
jgi:hypothetical protein